MGLVLHIIRHGEVYNPDEILYARLPHFHLSATGRKQAVAAARYLIDRPITHIYSSPMVRAQETATYIAVPHLNTDVILEERINEIYSPYEGVKLSELEKRGFRLYDDIDKEYENEQDIFTRVWDFISECRQKHDGEEIVAVTHGDVVVFSFLYSRGVELKVQTAGDLQRIHGLGDPYPATAAINTLRFHTDHPDELPEHEYFRPY